MTIPILLVWRCHDSDTDLHGAQVCSPQRRGGAASYIPSTQRLHYLGHNPRQHPVYTHSCMCMQKSPEALTTEQTISTASAHPHTHPKPASSQQHQLLPVTNPECMSLPQTPPFAAFLAVPAQIVPSQRAEVQLCAPCLGKTKAVSEKCTTRRAEKPPLCNGITSSKLFTHQGENLAVGKTML